MIEFKTKLDMGHLLDFNEHITRGAQKVRSRKILYMCLLPAILLYMQLQEAESGSLEFSHEHSFIVIAVATAFWVPFIYFYMSWAYRNSVLKYYALGNNVNLLGEQTITINDCGISGKSAEASSSVTWKGLGRIEETNKYIYIFVSSLQAFIIPKQQLTNEVIMEIKATLIAKGRASSARNESSPNAV